MLDEAGRLHVVGMRQHEFLVLRRRLDLFAKFARAQRAIDQRHAHRLALAMAKAEPVTAREARRLGGRAGELVDHLAFRHRDPPERHRKAKFRRHEFDLDFAEPDLAGKRMIAAIAALGRIAESQQVTFIAARQILQPDVAVGREVQRIVGEIADRSALLRRWRRLDQIVIGEKIGHARHPCRVGLGLRRRLLGAGCRLRFQQAVGVVEGGPEDLAAGQILERRGNAPAHRHGRRSIGSLAPKRGSVARNARNKKIASIRSPRACLIASAASSRS